MAVPLLDLKRQFASIRGDVEAVIAEVVESQQFILGPKVADFEDALAAATGSWNAVGMSSGTDALLAILMALEIGPGDAVITTPYTFFATAGCIHRVGAEIVFVDIDPATCNLDPANLAECLGNWCRPGTDGHLVTPVGNRLRAVMPVHLYGQCADMDPITELAAAHGLVVIEDAAQAIGAEYPSRHGPRQAGAMADWGYFSFFPAKNLGAFGDAGAATCRDPEMAERLRSVRNHGMAERYYHATVGGNFRIDALQAAILHAKLPQVPAWNAARQRNAGIYAEHFAAAELADFLTLPTRPYEGRVASDHVFHQYVVRAARRDELLRHLAAHSIGHAVYYPVPLHRQECFASLGYKAGAFPESERAAAETLALPIFPELREEEIAEVVAVIRSFYR